MKKSIALIVFLLGASYLGFSQEKNNLNNLTSGKWYFDSMYVGEQQTALEKKENHWMSFSPDGKYKIVVDSEQKEGTWQIYEDTQEIRFVANDFEGVTQIARLTDKEFFFSMWQGDIAYTMKMTK